MATPAWGEARSSAHEAGSAVVGSFGVGDGLEAMLDERDGALRLSLPVAGLGLSWDSRAASIDRSHFGTGWSTGVAQIDTRGGVRVLTTSGRVHAADDTHPSGLAGYGAGDLRFEQTPGVLPARADGAVGETAYAFVLHELGGTATYFNDHGDPVARMSGVAERIDWRLDPTTAQQLTGIVSPDGVLTALDWEDPAAVLVRPAANLGDAARAQAGVWRIELDGGRISGVQDPLGGRTLVHMNGDGLIDRLVTESGATTTVRWHTATDGAPRVDQLTTTDADGAPLSTRTWRAVDSRTSSGWPHHDPATAPSTLVDDYATEVSDGSTTVRSTYSSLHTLGRRELIVTTASGAHAMTTTTFGYDGIDAGDPTNPATLPVNWSRPVEATRTFTDPQGASRVETESFGYDEYGRAVRQVGADGTQTLIGYGPDLADASLPTALPIVETTRAPDGSVSEARHTLHPSGAAVLATETHTGTDGVAGVLAGRTEWRVEGDGFVSEERAFHADDPDPAITRWERDTDLPAGRQRVTETVAVGTTAETSSSQVRSLVHDGVLEETDPLGNATEAEYDALGRITTVTDASGRTVHTGYATARTDGKNATIVTGPDRVTKTETRDAIGRVIQLHDDIAGGTTPTLGHVRVTERRAYPDAATVEVTDAWGATSIARQDPFGRTVQQIAANGLTKLFVHDDVANTTTTALTPTGRLADAELTTVERRDETGNVVATDGSRRDGESVAETQSEFDGFGRLQRTTTGTLESRIDHDARGNPALSTLTPVDAAAREADRDADSAAIPTEGSPIESIRRFDTRGNSLEKTLRSGDEARSGSSRTLDALDRVVTKTDQLGRNTTIEYTHDGLESRVVHGNGQVAEATYHPITRELLQTRVTAPGRTDVTTEYRYDPATGRQAAVLDPTRPDDSLIEYEWNALGLLVETRYPDGSTVRHEYDDHGRKLATTDAAATRTEYAYDDTGTLIAAVQRDEDGDQLASVAYTHDAFGRIARVERGNGVVTETTYTSASQIATERTTGPHGPISERRYEYDIDGNLTNRVDITHPSGAGTTAPAGAIERTTTPYEYDAYRRLTASAVYDGEIAGGDPTTRTTYELTVSGDIARETAMVTTDQGERETTVREFGYSVLGELQTITTTDPAGATTTTTQGYDAAGNLVRAYDGATTEFDAANRPIQHTTADGSTRDTTYWADGSRRALTTTAADGVPTSTTFAWDDGVLLTERHSGASAAQVSYLLGADRHARVVQPNDATAPAAIEYHGTDRHGNVTDLTDRAGVVAARYAYSDAGVRSTTATADDPAEGGGVTPANPFGYSGEYTHDDGSQHLSTRTYDPVTMRFTSMDTEELHNTFAYADLNPITKVDPSGRISQSDSMAITFAVIGVLVAVTGLFTGGASLSPFGIAATTVSAFDIGVAVAEALHVSRVIRLPEDVALELSIAALVSGFVIGAAGFAKRTFTRPSATAASPGPPRELSPTELFVRLDRKPPKTSDPGEPAGTQTTRMDEWQAYFAARDSRRAAAAPVLEEFDRLIAALNEPQPFMFNHSVKMSMVYAGNRLKLAAGTLKRWQSADHLHPQRMDAAQRAGLDRSPVDFPLLKDAKEDIRHAAAQIRYSVSSRTGTYIYLTRNWVRTLPVSEDTLENLASDAVALHLAGEIDAVLKQVTSLY